MKSYTIQNDTEAGNEKLMKYKPNTSAQTFVINKLVTIFVTSNTIEIAEMKTDSPRVNVYFNRNIERVKFKQENNVDMLEIYYNNNDAFQFSVNKTRSNNLKSLTTINNLYGFLMQSLRMRM
ncbi:MAG: hypothetical protein BEN19_02410 [Epulopiscium sp. Nuni2H_MBin003]|nr:MAG: hypothetical protein BEN19_02410 [Epulopiscium sp. Nuni2H_MBin003]